MKVSKIMSKLIQTGLFLFVFYILCGVVHSTVSDYLYSYNLFNAERGSVPVVAKTAENGLFNTPAYYVKTDINDKNPDDVYDGVLNRISALQMRNLDDGDQVKGFIIDNNHFFTLYDIVFDSVMALFGMILLLVLLLATLVWGISIYFPFEDPSSKKGSKNAKKGRRSKKNSKNKIKLNRNKQAKNKKSKKGKQRKTKDKERSFSFLELFLVVFFIVAFFLSGSFLLNGFNKLIPFGQTKTEAIILDKHSEREWYVYSMRNEYTADPLFELELQYEDQDGEIRRVVKEVTPHTYDKYGMFETIPISYRNNNPLNVFVRGTTFGDVIQFFVYGKFLFFSSISLVAIVIGFITFRRFFKKVKMKYGSLRNESE